MKEITIGVMLRGSVACTARFISHQGTVQHHKATVESHRTYEITLKPCFLDNPVDRPFTAHRIMKIRSAMVSRSLPEIVIGRRFISGGATVDAAWDLGDNTRNTIELEIT